MNTNMKTFTEAMEEPTAETAILPTANNAGQKARQPAAEQWEINAIGNFLLDLYHKCFITDQMNWLVQKMSLRAEFKKYLTESEFGAALSVKLQDSNGSTDIGTLLQRTNFLMHTPIGSKFYRIKNFNLYHFRSKKVNELDERRIHGDALMVATTNEESGTLNLEKLLNDFKVIENSEKYQLEYQRTEVQNRKFDFTLTSRGCYICQINFDKIEEYEEHVEYHGDETDFKSLETMLKLTSPMLELCYELCENSHYFCFTLKTNLQNVIIEKIIIVQSNMFYYVNNGSMPQQMPPDGKYQFFVDSHMFTILVEQPIVVVFRQKTTSRFAEQHHFMRTEPFPTVNFAVSPYRLSNAKLFKEKFKLEHYMPNLERFKQLSSITGNANLLKLAQNYQDKKDVTKNNIIESFTLMLEVEDIDEIVVYKTLTQTKVTLRQIGKEISLQLKNIRSDVYLENVLSPYDDVVIITEDPTRQSAALANDIFDKLLENDQATFKRTCENGQRNQKKYFGRVERVVNQRVVFECEKQIPEGNSYTVVFRPSRLLLRRQYRALQLLRCIDDEVVKRFLFPDNSFCMDRTMGGLAALYKLNLKDGNIYQNPEQLQAVQQIAVSNNLNAPYIVLGPPGTGKTTTIVEAIYQLLVLRPETRMLVMAGSNSACDEVALRLLRHISELGMKTITRVFSRSNDKRIENIDELLLENSNMYGTHFYPSVETLHEYRIVVCTLSVAGKLATGKFGTGDGGSPLYTHVFVDEASASTEPETLMGIMCAMSPRGSLILSGDPKQLGPVLRSQRAGDLGLGVSLMERLLRRECYKVDELGHYDHSIQARLRRNYRSHPEIVGLYNALYYDNELIPLAPKDAVNLAASWHSVPNADFPIIFHAEFGTSQQGRNTVSLANTRELDVVMDYVKDFMYFGINGEKIEESDIGIISPYKNQCTRIQNQLTLRNWHHIECGSVETFQGKEKNIIIASFVRSFTKTLGFLDNPRRLNVTLSRPRSLLVLIGNPRTLSLNADFKYVIDACKSHNSLIGAPYFEEHSEQDMKLLKDCVKSLSITNGNYQMSKKKKWYPKAKKLNNKNNTKTKQAAEQLGSDARKSDEEVVQLGLSMKKHVNPISNQKQRQRVVTYKNIIENEQKSKHKKQPQAPVKVVDEMDNFFDNLPLVPNNTETTNAGEKQNLKPQKPTPALQNPTLISQHSPTVRRSAPIPQPSTPQMPNPIPKKSPPKLHKPTPMPQNTTTTLRNSPAKPSHAPPTLQRPTTVPQNATPSARKSTTTPQNAAVVRNRTEGVNFGNTNPSHFGVYTVRTTTVIGHNSQSESAAQCTHKQGGATASQSQSATTTRYALPTTTLTHLPYEHRPMASVLNDAARRVNASNFNQNYAGETHRPKVVEKKKKACVMM